MVDARDNHVLIVRAMRACPRLVMAYYGDNALLPIKEILSERHASTEDFFPFDRGQK